VRDLAILGRQIRYTNRSFWRNPAAAFFTFAFPLMFLVIFTALFGNVSICPVLATGRCPIPEISTSTFYISAIATFSIITATYTNLATSVAFLKDLGVLKRIRGTPAPAWTYLAGRVIHSILLAILLVAIVTAFGVAFYNAELPSHTFLAFATTIVVGAACFSALGLALTAVIPNADAAPAVVNASILPLLFLSDIFIPIQDPNAWYVQVAKVFPPYHFAQAMKAAYFAPAGSGFSPDHLLVIGIWGLVGLFLAVRFFRWEPRR
jgi:ABC-2 type transport system permease protein